MRMPLVHPYASYLEYEIRNIVEDARKLAACGVEMTWENIGDPIAMGERVEPWIRETVADVLRENRSWAYCPSRGVEETRAYLAAEVNARGGVRIGPEDIIFYNGLGEAIGRIYSLLAPGARVLMPNPCYPTHLSNEIMRGGHAPLFFHLDPNNAWQPDPDEIRRLVQAHPEVAAITVINPDNPTGQVYEREHLKAIVAIAREYRLFLICDEIYARICYNGASTPCLSRILGEVPALVLRGISKEYPWPGARCGWIEIMNAGRDPEFAAYARTLVKAKMMEVCSTTMPQMSIPRVMGDARYPGHLRARAARFEARSRDAWEAFRELDEVIVHPTRGAFYFPVVFKAGVLDDRQELPIANARARELVAGMVAGVPPDKRLVYYLLAAAGICVTPLCGFHSQLHGFRITLLQSDDAKRRDTLRRLVEAIREYLG